MTDIHQDGEPVRSDNPVSSQPASPPADSTVSDDGPEAAGAVAPSVLDDKAAPVGDTSPADLFVEGQTLQTDVPQSGAAGDQAVGADHDADQEAPGPDETLVCVRYGRMNALGLFRSKIGDIPRHTRVVIKSDRGLEIGTVLCKGSPQLTYEGKPLRRMGSVRRIATHDDLTDEKHLHQSEARARKFCDEQIRKRKLPMQLVDVEYLFGGDRIIFYFLAESRVDFRDLVKDLAHEFQTRIEMRQIGVRDEARLLADYERCGQFICCRAFIKEFQPISMKMAKVQKATLDPSKISGRCGRLMCCLRFENETYEELKKALPRKNSFVLTEMGPGKVIGGDILTQLVKVFIGGKVHVVPLDALLARDLTEAQVQEAMASRPARPMGRRPEGPDRSPDREDGSSMRRPDRPETRWDDRRPPAPSVAASETEADVRAADEEVLGPQEVAATSEAGSGQQQPSSKRRRRGRRRRKSRGDRNGAPGAAGRENGKEDRGLGVPRAVLEDLGIVSGGEDRGDGGAAGGGSNEAGGGQPSRPPQDRREGDRDGRSRGRRRRGRRSHRRGRSDPGGDGRPGAAPDAGGSPQ
jgi:cell fate regulator YaaT (PSP1 superfamily)